MGSSNYITKLRALDGANLGNFPVGSQYGIAFDGANIWVANQGSNTVTKLRASDGVSLGAFIVGPRPYGVAFDGANIWVATFFTHNVTKLRASDGTTLGNFPVGNDPVGITFDGANIWSANSGSDSVTKIFVGDDVGPSGDSTPDTIADDGVISDAEASDVLTINNGLLFAPTTENMGIGTTSPALMLQVGEDTTPNSQGMIRFESRSGTGPGGSAWNAGVPETDEDYSGTGYSFVIDNIATGNTEFVVTWDTGNTGIGRLPTANKLEVEGNASKTAAGDWLANSDAAIKTKVRSVEDALSTIERLRPVAFRYADDYKAKHPSVKDQDYYNYIAQEFRQVFPDWVQDSGEDGLLQMDSHPASVYAVAAIQELHHIVQEKDCEIENLKSEIASLKKLEARLARLEVLLHGTTEDSD